MHALWVEHVSWFLIIWDRVLDNVITGHNPKWQIVDQYIKLDLDGSITSLWSTKTIIQANNETQSASQGQ